MSHVARTAWVASIVGVGLLAGRPNDVHAQSFATDSVPTFHLQGPTVRIGSVDDSAYAFGTVLGLAEGPDGSLYSIHRTEAVVHRWTASGKAAGTIGSRGKGPGEFTAPSDLGFFGDTLWVMDLFAHRASYFRPDGRFLGSVEPRVVVAPSPRNPAALVPHAMRPFHDGSWYGRGSGRAVDLASADGATDRQRQRCPSRVTLGKNLGTPRLGTSLSSLVMLRILVPQRLLQSGRRDGAAVAFGHPRSSRGRAGGSSRDQFGRSARTQGSGPRLTPRSASSPPASPRIPPPDQRISRTVPRPKP